jgi:hypothetical protein
VRGQRRSIRNQTELTEICTSRHEIRGRRSVWFRKAVWRINANQTKEMRDHKTLKSPNAISSKFDFAPSFNTADSVGRQLAPRMPSDITSLARTHFANGAVFVHKRRADTSSATAQALHDHQSAKKGLSCARRTQRMVPEHLSAFKPNARIGWPAASMPGRKRAYPHPLPHPHRAPNRGFAKPPRLILRGDKNVVLRKVFKCFSSPSHVPKQISAEQS